MSQYQHVWGRRGVLRIVGGETTIDIPLVQISRPDTNFEPVEEINGEVIRNASGHTDAPSAGFRWKGEIGVLNLLAGQATIISQLVGLFNNYREVTITPNYTGDNDMVLENMRVTFGPRITELTMHSQRGQLLHWGFEAVDRVNSVSTTLSDIEVRYMSPDGVKYTSPDGVKKTIEGGA